MLAALAAGAFAAVAAASGRALVTARRDATGTTLATARLESLRAGPRTSGADDVAADGVDYGRRWSATGGRGRPHVLDVGVEWPGHAFRLSTEALP